MTIIAIVCLSLAGTAAAQEKVTLKQDVAPGKYEVVRTVEANQTKMEQGPGGSDRTVETRTTMSITGDVVLEPSDKDGTKKGSFAYRRITAEITAGPNSMRYDSDDPNVHADLLAEAMKFVVGVKFSFDLFADGNIQNVKGIDLDSWTQFWRPKSGEDSNLRAMAPQAVIYVEPGYVLRDLLQPTWLPEGPVAVGDQWNPKPFRDPNSLVYANTEIEYTARLAGIEGGLGARARAGFERKSHLMKATELPAYTLERSETKSQEEDLFDLGRKMVVSYKGSYTIESVASNTLPNGQKLTTVLRRDSVLGSSLTPAVNPATAPGAAK
jgi:hypothetical protein